jgi:IS30 family transposase
LATVQKFF